MCLSQVDKNVTIVAYQVVGKNGYGKYRSIHGFGNRWLSPGVWHKSHGNAMGSYEHGFHAFFSQKDAESYWCPSSSACVVRVILRDIICTGIQDGRRAVVARRRMIVREVGPCGSSA